MTTIRLLAITTELAAALENPMAFSDVHAIELGEHAALTREVALQNEAYRQRIAAPEEWGGFLAVDEVTQRVIGTCAFKGAPNEGREVEIAYFTFPPYERLGFGTAMAAALYDRAERSGLVRTVFAHTLPEGNASTRILGRIGFHFVGLVLDPEDGAVWRWERAVARSAA